MLVLDVLGIVIGYLIARNYSSCGGNKKVEVKVNETYLIFEIYSVASIELNTFPESVEINNKLYHLRGLIAYYGPGISTEKFSPITTGHFIAFCKRQNGWQKFDDLATKSTNCNANNTVISQMLFYSI